MALAKTPGLTNRNGSQLRKLAVNGKRPGAQILPCHRADLPWVRAAAISAERFKFALKKEFQAELDASRTAAAENRVPQANIGRCGDRKES